MKLIIVNGSCGVGKSTLSIRLHNNIPLSFLLNIDAQRRFISKYREKNKQSSQMNLLIANSILETCMKLDRDVVIDKMFFDEKILESYYKIAKKYKANVYEIILWAPKEIVMKRAHERGWRKDGLLTRKKCEHFWHEIDNMKNKRPQAHIINTENIGIDEVYKKALKIIKS